MIYVCRVYTTKCLSVGAFIPGRALHTPCLVIQIALYSKPSEAKIARHMAHRRVVIHSSILFSFPLPLYFPLPWGLRPRTAGGLWPVAALPFSIQNSKKMLKGFKMPFRGQLDPNMLRTWLPPGPSHVQNDMCFTVFALKLIKN